MQTKYDPETPKPIFTISLLSRLLNLYCSQLGSSLDHAEEAAAVGAPAAELYSQTLLLGSCSPPECTSFLWHPNCIAAER